MVDMKEDEAVPRVEAARAYVKALRTLNRIDEHTYREFMSILGVHPESGGYEEEERCPDCSGILDDDGICVHCYGLGGGE